MARGAHIKIGKGGAGDVGRWDVAIDARHNCVEGVKHPALVRKLTNLSSVRRRFADGNRFGRQPGNVLSHRHTAGPYGDVAVASQCSPYKGQGDNSTGCALVGNRPENMMMQGLEEVL